MSYQNYNPRTRIQLKLKQQQMLDIAHATGLPLSKVYKYSDLILQKSLKETIKDIIPMIHKYAPKATGQLRNSLEHFLKQSDTRSSRILNMRFGSYINYLKYVGGMSARNLRHPRGPLYLPRQRNTKWGKKGQPKRNPVNWRWVNYYGAPRWVRLDDPKSQTNFFTILLLHIKTTLQKYITMEIANVVPASVDRRHFTRRYKVKPV